MARFEVAWSTDAEADLLAIYDHIVADGSPLTALTYSRRIEARCLAIPDAPRGGRRREEFGVEVRSIAFQSVTIFYEVRTADVLILRVLHGARDHRRLFDQ